MSRPDAREPSERTVDDLWRDYAAAVVRYARRRVPPDEVDEVVAETFVVAWRRLDEIPDVALPWLLGVARGVSANALRARRRREALHGRLGALMPEDLGVPEHGERLDPALTALSRLREDDRELLMLLGWDGLTREQIAEALGVTRGTLAVRLHRARRRLLAELARLDPSDSSTRAVASDAPGHPSLEGRLA